MRTYISGTISMLLIAYLSTCVIAANGNKGDWGFDTKYYKYALIEGEITSIDHDNRIFHVKGVDEQIFFCEHTEFFIGDISLPMERVYYPVKFSKDQKIQAVNVSVGDVIKSRYSKCENGKIFMDTCLVGKDRKFKEIPGGKNNAFLSEK